jgi:hypothetical protein
MCVLNARIRRAARFSSSNQTHKSLPLNRGGLFVFQEIDREAEARSGASILETASASLQAASAPAD